MQRWELQLERHRLLCDGEPVPLGGRAFDLLVALWERRDRVVDKAELIELVWPSRFVQENNLQVQIGHLRKLLGAEAIATVAGRGYRYTGAVQIAVAGLPAGASDASVQPVSSTPIERLHGREASLAAVGELFARHALVTVVGAGGIGKTALARQVFDAHGSSHPHADCWVDLSDTVEPGHVARAVARALGVDPGGADALTAVCAALAPLQTRVALDGAEHLLDEVATLAQSILQAAPGVKLLVTSQAPLRLSREGVHRLGPLAVPDGPLPAAQALLHGAIALFDERARSIDERFVLTDGLAGDVIRLCRRVDGSPLAIELIVDRLPLVGVHGLASLLDEPLRLLNRNRKRDAPARHQTLRAGLQRSHDLLDEREQVVFRRLGVFPGDMSLDAIQQVAAEPGGALDGWAAMDALGLLVERSLVTLSTDDVAAPHYRLGHATRAYALECLLQAGECDALERRHARWQSDSLLSESTLAGFGDPALDPSRSDPPGPARPLSAPVSH